ncbi:MAG TPA: hypothetical protein VFF88_02445, partial [Methylocella sp.]|nr:hypothetical protein [Methylocella sp.]
PGAPFPCRIASASRPRFELAEAASDGRSLVFEPANRFPARFTASKGWTGAQMRSRRQIPSSFRSLRRAASADGLRLSSVTAGPGCGL